MVIYLLSLNIFYLYFFAYFTAKYYIRMFTAGVVPCGGPKTYPRTSSVVQIIIHIWSFVISVGVLRNQEFVGSDSFSNQRLIYLAPFFVSNTLIKVANLLYLSLV